jgi:DnaJ-class molecular chaperone
MGVFTHKEEEKVETPSEEVKKEEVKPETVAVNADPRAMYNCSDCNGFGLKDQYTLCPKCGGTGKI